MLAPLGILARAEGWGAVEEQRPEAMGLRERVAYLVGLTRAGGAEGDQTGLLPEILALLADMAREVDRLRAGEQVLTGTVRTLRGHLAELADEVFGGDTTLLHCDACGQAMRVLTADLHDDRIELVCPCCGHVVHAYDHGLDYDEDEDTLDSQPDGPEADGHPSR